jgi:hypothetical protein
MKKIILILMLAFLTGCATAAQWQRGERRPGYSVPSVGSTQGQKTPKHKAAAVDQVLFKRAILSLRPTPQVPASKRGRELLKRLRREYPASPWSAQASSIMELISITDTLARQNEELKATNRSLIREINELNDSIDQLKALERELEQKR